MADPNFNRHVPCSWCNATGQVRPDNLHIDVERFGGAGRNRSIKYDVFLKKFKELVDPNVNYRSKDFKKIYQQYKNFDKRTIKNEKEMDEEVKSFLTIHNLWHDHDDDEEKFINDIKALMEETDDVDEPDVDLSTLPELPPDSPSMYDDMPPLSPVTPPSPPAPRAPTRPPTRPPTIPPITLPPGPAPRSRIKKRTIPSTKTVVINPLARSQARRDNALRKLQTSKYMSDADKFKYENILDKEILIDPYSGQIKRFNSYSKDFQPFSNNDSSRSAEDAYVVSKTSASNRLRKVAKAKRKTAY